MPNSNNITPQLTSETPLVSSSASTNNISQNENIAGIEYMQKTANRDIKAAEEAISLIQNAFNASVENASKYAGQNTDVKTGKIRYNIKYSFNNQVDDALSKTMQRGYSVYVGKLPKLLEKCGLNSNLPLLMNQSHLRDINHEKDVNNIHYHGISAETIKHLPEMLKNPAMIYDSISEDNKENSVCVLTTECDSDGDPIVVIITNSEQNSKYLDVKMETVKSNASNHIDTMYGKNSFDTHIDEIIKKDAVLFVSKDGIGKLLNRKNLSLNSDGKLQLLARLDKLRFDTIIHQSRNVVNTYSMQKNEKHSLKSLAEYEKEIDKSENSNYNEYNKDLLESEESNLKNTLLRGDIDESSEGSNSDRIGELSQRNRDKGRGDKGNKRHISDAEAEVESETVYSKSDRKRIFSEGSGLLRVGNSPQGSTYSYEAGGERANGRRFLETLKNGDEKTARKILNEHARENGFTPVTQYHGTTADEVFTSFNGDGAVWVTPDLGYAEGYTEGYYGNDKRADGLYTHKESGVYELYVKKGKVLDLGNIEKEIKTLDDINNFTKQIGFTEQEVRQCWNSGRKFESNRIWAITNTLEFAEFARKYGYDSLRAVEGKKNIETFGILHKENVKSAKLETYDNEGNIIPLEERFDTTETDIRYSLKSLAENEKEIEEATKLNQKIELTEKEYKDFGWARANDILSSGQNADYRSKFAMAKSGQAKFPKSKNGEYIISVSDIYESDLEGINNVLVFAKGKIDKPIITSIIEIYEYDETELADIRRYIYGLERRGIFAESGQAFQRYYASDFANEYKRSDIKDGRNYNDDGLGRGDSEENKDTHYSLKSLMEYEKRLDEQIEKYGEMKKGMEPRRDVSVPKRTEKGTKVRRTAR